MNVASSGSLRTISSASRRIWAQTGSIFSMEPVARTCCRAMTISCAFRSTSELSITDREQGYMKKLAPEPEPAMMETRLASGRGSMLSRLLGEKAQHCPLECLVSDGKHVVAPWDVEHAAARHQGRELLGGTSNGVLCADRNPHRRADQGPLLARQGLPRTPHAAAEPV